MRNTSENVFIPQKVQDILRDIGVIPAYLSEGDLLTSMQNKINGEVREGKFVLYEDPYAAPDRPKQAALILLDPDEKVFGICKPNEHPNSKWVLLVIKTEVDLRISIPLILQKYNQGEFNSPSEWNYEGELEKTPPADPPPQPTTMAEALKFQRPAQEKAAAAYSR